MRCAFLTLMTVRVISLLGKVCGRGLSRSRCGGLSVHTDFSFAAPAFLSVIPSERLVDRLDRKGRWRTTMLNSVAHYFIRRLQMAGKARRIKKRIDIPVERKFGLYHG